MRVFITLTLSAIGSFSFGQGIEGRIYDRIKAEPLIGATISIEGTDLGAISDSNGYYSLSNLAPGRVNLQITFIGYETLVITDVWVKQGKVTLQNAGLTSNSIRLDQIVVKSANPMISPGKRSLNEEQINRFAAAYNDPARLVVTSADLAITNDQNNEISVRGLSPDYNVWRVEGVEVANPNQLQNAGTALDQPAGTSGGVNVISAQILDQSSFHYGSMSNQLNNSVGGIFDMYLRNGVSNDHQFTAQASLIGFDFSAEGPVSKNQNTTYIANYRYSFTGLLAEMGVDFGGETIGYQDLAFNINQSFKSGGSLKVFGVGGTSYNNFNHRPFNKSEVEKDRMDIRYDGKVGFTGFRLNKSGFNLAMAISGFENTRKETGYDSLDRAIYNQVSERNKSTIASDISHQFSWGGGQLMLGVTNNFYAYADIGVVQFLGQYYANAKQSLSNKFQLEAGLTVLNSGDEIRMDGRGSMGLQINDDNYLSLSVGQYSQQLNPYNNYFIEFFTNWFYGTQDGLNNYGFLSSIRYNLDYSTTFSGFDLDMGGFFYDFPEVVFLRSTEIETSASTVGGYVQINRNFSDGWYGLLGLTIFDSQVEEVGNNPFNTRHNLSTAIGKEFSKVKKGHKKVFTINGRLTWQGGAYYNRTDGVFGEQIFIDRFDDYVRIDLRAQWTKSKEKVTSIWAIDIQNALSRENQAFVYYDFFLDRMETSTQLGLIPVLTYRLEF